MSIQTKPYSFYESQNLHDPSKFRQVPESVIQSQMHRVEMQKKFMNNRQFFQMTHTDMTRKCIGEQASVVGIVENLPQEYIDIYANKTVHKTKSQMKGLMMSQERVSQIKETKRHLGRL
jgi:hypothetical protein